MQARITLSNQEKSPQWQNMSKQWAFQVHLKTLLLLPNTESTMTIIIIFFNFSPPLYSQRTEMYENSSNGYTFTIII